MSEPSETHFTSDEIRIMQDNIRTEVLRDSGPYTAASSMSLFTAGAVMQSTIMRAEEPVTPWRRYSRESETRIY